MKKGISEQAVLLLGAITLLFFSAYVTWTFVYGRQHPRPEELNSGGEEKPVVEACSNDIDCKFDNQGSKCIDVADPNFPDRFHKICGCDKNEHCESTSDVARSGACGQDNKCS